MPGLVYFLGLHLGQVRSSKVRVVLEPQKVFILKTEHAVVGQEVQGGTVILEPLRSKELVLGAGPHFSQDLGQVDIVFDRGLLYPESGLAVHQVRVVELVGRD